MLVIQKMNVGFSTTAGYTYMVEVRLGLTQECGMCSVTLLLVSCIIDLN